ncbi:hypothetical protein [Prevotella pallens]|nr:hypothetical protein [Prevotella pallens]
MKNKTNETKNVHTELCKLHPRITMGVRGQISYIRGINIDCA